MVDITIHNEDGREALLQVDPFVVEQGFLLGEVGSYIAHRLTGSGWSWTFDQTEKD